jgi:quinolinate synthase
VGGTGGILRFARESGTREMIIGTEMGLIYQLQKQNPAMTFVSASEKLVCRTMKLITLDDIINALTEMKHIVKVPEEIRVPARRALDRMLAIS